MGRRLPRKWWYDEEHNEVHLPGGCKARVRLCIWGILRIHIEAHFDFSDVPEELKRDAYRLMAEWANSRQKQLAKKRKVELTFSLINI